MTMTWRVVFMGTPQFAVPTLQLLIDQYQVVGVIAQPDRPSGRGRKLQPSPVKTLAQKYGLTVLQPVSLRDPETLAALRSMRPAVIVVAAFGQILRPQVLDLPPAGCINVHASLLPRWRGAAPVAAAILAGDDTTGVTIMQVDAGLDTGPILNQRSFVIAPDGTQESLTARLATLGADLLRDTLPDWLAGKIKPRPQDDALATLAPRIRKEQGRINWSDPADGIARKVRAFYPWPGAFACWRDTPLRIVRAVATTEYPMGKEGSSPLPGMVIAGADVPAVVTGRGLLRLLEVQPPGKRPMPADAFARGARGFVGDCLA